MAIRFNLIVNEGNYTIETLSTGELHIGATGNLSSKLDSGDGRFHITDKAWRNWKPILEAYSDEIAVTDSAHSYDDDVLTDEQLVAYLQDIIKTPDSGGGGGGDSVTWGDITGDMGDQEDLTEVLGVIYEGLGSKQATLTFDSAPTANSENPVTSGGIKTALDGKQATLTFDSAPTANSENPVTSGGIKTALDGKQATLTFDSAPTANSENPVTSGGIKTALDGKQATLTFDSAPTANSENPVTSGGIKTALDGKADAGTARFTIHAEYNVTTGAVTLASGTTQVALMAALTAKKAMDIDFMVSGTYYRNPMLSFYEDGTGAHEVRFRNDAMGFDVVLKANTTSNTYAFEVRQFVMTESAYSNLQSVDPALIYYLTADPQS